MSKLTFRTTPCPADYRRSFDPFLFSDARHLALQTTEPWHQCYLVNQETRKILAQFLFVVQDGVALSPVRAPFGTLQCASDLSAEDVWFFLQKISEYAARQGARKLRMVEPPTHYGSHTAMLHTCLFNQQFHASEAAASALIAAGEDFEKGLDSWERRKLRQSRRAGFVTVRVPRSQSKEVYDFIQQCRHAKGQSLSMSWEALHETMNVFRKEFLFFVVRDKERLAAAAICIRVNHDVLYNFYSAHDSAYDRQSPVVLLMEGLVAFARSTRAQWVDLGTSALNGQPNFPLLDFKRRLGATTSLKLTFEKVLTS